MKRTLSSPGSATGPNVEELPGGEAEAAPGDEGASASDVRSMIESSTFMEDALAVLRADFPTHGVELDIFQTGYRSRARARKSLSLQIFTFCNSRVPSRKPGNAGGALALLGVEVVSSSCSA